jgi:hypothetical protein
LRHRKPPLAPDGFPYRWEGFVRRAKSVRHREARLSHDEESFICRKEGPLWANKPFFVMKKALKVARKTAKAARKVSKIITKCR